MIYLLVCRVDPAENEIRPFPSYVPFRYKIVFIINSINFSTTQRHFLLAGVA